jgi:hypothetical protein
MIEALFFAMVAVVVGLTLFAGGCVLFAVLGYLSRTFAYVFAVTLLVCTMALCSGCGSMPLHEQAFHTMNVIDTGQTIHIAREPSCYREVGFPTAQLHGDHPSEGEVYATMAAYSLAYHYARKWLDRKVAESEPGSQEQGWWAVGRATLFGAVLIGKAATIANNADIELQPWGRVCP